uniref:TOG domain-containing protein n=1 Tax=Ficedula albicollis TaxID=59894 RepID=A0A803VA28_FICAL
MDLFFQSSCIWQVPIGELSNLLEAKGFEAWVEGVALLLDLCKNSPQLIATNIVQIFNSFVLRVAESNKKVKQKALNVLAEIIAILKDAMNPVVVLLVEGITKSLNSKDSRVHAAAVNALEESMAHLACVPVPAELVEEVYASSPEVIQQCALPVLWSCPENKALPVRSANVCTVVTRLTSALYEVMGTKLRKCAASQPRHVGKVGAGLLSGQRKDLVQPGEPVHIAREQFCLAGAPCHQLCCSQWPVEL